MISISSSWTSQLAPAASLIIGLTAYTIPKLARAECISKIDNVCHQLNSLRGTYIRIILIKVLESSLKFFQFSRSDIGMCSRDHLQSASKDLYKNRRDPPDSRRKQSSSGYYLRLDPVRIPDHQMLRLYNRFLPLLLPGNSGLLLVSCHSDGL